MNESLAHLEKPPQARKPKRGDIRDDGRVFWARSRRYANGEQWVSPDAYPRMREQARRLTRINQAKKCSRLQHRVKKHKRGDVRGDGMVFWAMSKTIPGGEEWVSEADFTTRKTKAAEYSKNYQKAIRANSILHLFIHSVRGRINELVARRHVKNKGKLDGILGCKFSDFTDHLEATFKPGMTWENRGDWELDHVVPLASSKDIPEALARFHYTNTKALWAIENRLRRCK